MSKYTDALKDAGKASLTLAVTGAEGARILLSATARIGAAALSDGMGKLSKVTEEAAKKIPTKTNADSTTGEVLGTVSKVPFLSKLAVNTSKLSKDGSKIMGAAHDHLAEFDRKSIDPVRTKPRPSIIPDIQSIRTYE
jgi:hypothetical protein